MVIHLLKRILKEQNGNGKKILYMPSVKTNFVYNLILTISTYLINLVLFPYVSRTLGVDLVGKIGFVNNVVAYFSLFALLGIGTIGIREIAACEDNFEKRSKVFSELFSFILCLTIGVVVIFVLCIFFVPRFSTDANLFLLGGVTLFFTSLLLEWLYQGLENFKFIAIRTVILKIVYALSVFVFVKNSSDYVLYFAITVLLVVANAIINILYSRNFVKFKFALSGIKRYSKPITSLGVYKIMTSLYTTFNVIYLGFVCTDTEVGYYYTSIKIFTIILGILTAFTNVMMPRMSKLLAEGKIEEFKQKINKSFELVFSIAIPLISICVVLAPQIVKILAGSGYDGAILPMRIVTFNVFFVGIAQIWVIQLLIPLKKDNVILISSFIGAVVGIGMNFLLISKIGAIGSAIVLLVSEIAGDAYSFWYATRNRYLEFPYKKLIKDVITCIPYWVICIVIMQAFDSTITVTLLSLLLCLIYFAMVNLWINPNEIIRNMIINRIK